MASDVERGLKFAPELATLVSTPPEGEAWLHELKFDGFRMSLILEGKRARWVSRHGKGWTSALPELVTAARELDASSAVLDGELAVLLPSGLTSFQGLQNALNAPVATRQLVYFAWDLMHLSGRDLTKAPLEARKEALRVLIAPLGPTHPIKYTDHVIGDGPRVFEHASKLGAEGIVSKRRRSIYRAGRTRDWVKTKCWRTHSFVVCGYTAVGEGALGELLVGYYDRSGQLRFAGSVGTGKGFTLPFRAQLRTELEILRQVESPIPGIRGTALVRWVKPVLVAEIAYAELTAGHQLRHPSFRAFQPQARARDVVLDLEPTRDEPNPRMLSISATRWSRKR